MLAAGGHIESGFPNQPIGDDRPGLEFFLEVPRQRLHADRLVLVRGVLDYPRNEVVPSADRDQQFNLLSLFLRRLKSRFAKYAFHKSLNRNRARRRRARFNLLLRSRGLRAALCHGLAAAAF